MEEKEDRYSSIIKQKRVVVAHEEQCFLYTANLAGSVEYSEAQYVCSPVEADTRMVYHLSVLSKAVPRESAVVCSTDTDVMVILLYHANKLEANVWMDLRHSSDNTRELANHLGPVLCKALPGYHALTGCDYTSSFFRKGKVNQLKKAEKCALHLEGLGKIGEKSTFVDSDNLVEKYVCSLFDQGSLSTVNDVRFKIFLQKYKPTQPNSPLEKTKGIDAGMLPPCKDLLMQKLARCNYVCDILMEACTSLQLQACIVLIVGDPLVSMEPTNHGWKEENGFFFFLPHWFRGSQMPSILSETMDPTDFSDREKMTMMIKIMISLVKIIQRMKMIVMLTNFLFQYTLCIYYYCIVLKS